jgi:hypothetical protein
MLTLALRLSIFFAVFGLAASKAEDGACIPSGRATEVLINERFRIGMSSLLVSSSFLVLLKKSADMPY